MNNLNIEMQPAWHISDQLYVTDEKGRRWETAGYGSSAAVAKGYEQPASHVPPGFEQVTAAVFEVPADAQNLVLVWEGGGDQAVVELAAPRSPDSIPRLSLPVPTGHCRGQYQVVVLAFTPCLVNKQSPLKRGGF